MPGPMLGARRSRLWPVPMSHPPSSTLGFAGLVSALELAGHDELAAKLTPDADPGTIEEVRRALVVAREPHRVKLSRIDFALGALHHWQDRHPRCSCGALAVVKTMGGPLCARGFAMNGNRHTPD